LSQSRRKVSLRNTPNSDRAHPTIVLLVFSFSLSLHHNLTSIMSVQSMHAVWVPTSPRKVCSPSFPIPPCPFGLSFFLFLSPPLPSSPPTSRITLRLTLLYTRNMLLILLPLLLSLFTLPTFGTKLSIEPIPRPPKFQWLFTANLLLLPNTAPLVPGPYGIRIDLPIIGGTFKGRNGLEGTIRNDTADWGTIDPQTGIGQADARWALVAAPTGSTQGADSYIYVFSSGPTQKRGGLNRAHLRLRFETGVSCLLSYLFRVRVELGRKYCGRNSS
jgi:hypothetical protein